MTDETQKPDEEKDFRVWYSAHAVKWGLDPNPDDPQHQYDYRAAYRAGASPDKVGHWPSQFKSPGHPNRFVEGMDTISGEPETLESRAEWAKLRMEQRRRERENRTLLPTEGAEESVAYQPEPEKPSYYYNKQDRSYSLEKPDDMAGWEEKGWDLPAEAPPPEEAPPSAPPPPELEPQGPSVEQPEPKPAPKPERPAPPALPDWHGALDKAEAKGTLFERTLRSKRRADRMSVEKQRRARVTRRAEQRAIARSLRTGKPLPKNLAAKILKEAEPTRKQRGVSSWGIPTPEPSGGFDSRQNDQLAKDVAELKKMLEETVAFIRELRDDGIEGVFEEE